MKKFTTFLLSATLFALVLLPVVSVHAQKSSNVCVDSTFQLVRIDDRIFEIIINTSVATNTISDYEKKFVVISDTLDAAEIRKDWGTYYDSKKQLALMMDELNALLIDMNNQKKEMLSLYDRRNYLIAWLHHK